MIYCKAGEESITFHITMLTQSWRAQSQPKGASYRIDDTVYQTNYLDLNLHIDNINEILQQQKKNSSTKIQTQQNVRQKPNTFQQDQQNFRYRHPAYYACYKAMTLGDQLACKQFIFPENVKMQHTIQSVAKKIIKKQFKKQLEEDLEQSIKNVPKVVTPKQIIKQSQEPNYVDHLINVGSPQIGKSTPLLISPFPTRQPLRSHSPSEKNRISNKQIELNLGKNENSVIVSIQFDNISNNSLAMRMI